MIKKAEYRPLSWGPTIVVTVMSQAAFCRVGVDEMFMGRDLEIIVNCRSQ